MTGTSTNGPITAANAAPELIPNTATATAMASSKLFEAAVKRERRGLRVIRSELLSHVERDQEHDHEIDQQRHRNPQNIERQPDDVRRPSARTSP